MGRGSYKRMHRHISGGCGLFSTLLLSHHLRHRRLWHYRQRHCRPNRLKCKECREGRCEWVAAAAGACAARSAGAAGLLSTLF